MGKSILVLLGLFAMEAHADESVNFTCNHADYSALKSLTYHVDSMPTSLTEKSILLRDAEFVTEENKKSKLQTQNLKPYTFLQDQTFVGIPIFVAGIIAKKEKASFRQNYDSKVVRTRLVRNFHNEIDNYTQYVPMALAAGLNFAGYQGRSDTWRFLASGAMSYALMAAIVNPIKYSVKEIRPDGSTKNSWPSGHTATAFVGATILHKEYGLTRSPWFSVGGYALATATGVMRVLNNRHWVSDVLSGAGIGILSTELAYGFSDLIFKGKHLHRNDLETTSNIIENPSFFDISMGVGLGTRNMTFDADALGLEGDENNELNLKFGTSTVMGVEGAYFFNKYVGVGGRLRVRSTPIKGWNELHNSHRDEIKKYFADLVEMNIGKMLSEWTLTVESDHFTEFTGDVGVYLNFPFSKRFAIGTKFLTGRSVIQDLDINARAKGYRLQNYEEIVNRDDSKPLPTPIWTNSKGEEEPYDYEYDYITVSGNNTAKFGTGLSLTYAYKSNFAWKVFVDYDYTRKNYTLTFNPYGFGPYATTLGESYDTFQPTKSTIKKNMNNFVLGCAFTVSF